MEVKNMIVKSVYDAEFRRYGQVLEGYDFTELFDALSKCAVPEQGIAYVASVVKLERCAVFWELQNRGFGGIPVQLGYCSGRNDTLNCLEYHKSSEFNIAKDDIVLLLGFQGDMENGHYDTAQVQAFHVPAHTGVELYGTTLHYAPCGYYPADTYQVICVLPEGTNVGVPDRNSAPDGEDRMCLGTNKWLLAHPESEAAKQGAYVGLTGENLMYDGPAE